MISECINKVSASSSPQPAEGARQLWSAMTGHRFAQAACRRQTRWNGGFVLNVRPGWMLAPLHAALPGRPIAPADKAATSRRTAKRRGACWGMASPASGNWPTRRRIACWQRRRRMGVQLRQSASALECGDLSSLSAGDLSPSNAVVRMHCQKRSARVVRRTALRGAAWPTSQPSGQSGDKSPHSKARRRVCL